MAKKKQEKLSKDEVEISEEVMDEVNEEIKEETPRRLRLNARHNGILSVVIALIGFIVITFFQPLGVIISFIALIFTRYAIRGGERKLGLVGGIIAFIGVLSFVIFAGMIAPTLGTDYHFLN